MKELKSHIKENLLVVAQQAIKKQPEFLGSLKIHPGQTCWQLNINTGELTPAVFDEVTCTLTGKLTKKIVIKPFHLYCAALNKDVAWKKFVQMLNLKK